MEKCYPFFTVFSPINSLARHAWQAESKKPEYMFVGNIPLSGRDYLGLAAFDPCLLSGMAEKTELGGVVCVNGNATPCVWDQNWKHKPSPTVRKCALLHEQTHVDSPYRDPCPKCSVVRGTTGNKDKDECAAYLATKECLDKIILVPEDYES